MTVYYMGLPLAGDHRNIYDLCWFLMGIAWSGCWMVCALAYSQAGSTGGPRR